MPVVLHGANVVVAEAAIPVSVNTMIFAVAAISSMGTNANKTFTNVSGTIGGVGPGQADENSRLLANALNEYHKAHGRFPAAASYDTQGQPLLSWRVELLPFLGERALHQQFKLDEPWDSVHNKKMLKKMPKVFQTWSPESWKTRYLAFTGPGSAFEGTKGLARSDFKDGPEQTLLLADAGFGHGVTWSKPADLVCGAAGDLPVFEHNFGFSAVFADGSARWVNGGLDAKVLRALITRSGGEHLEEQLPGSWRLLRQDALRPCRAQNISNRIDTCRRELRMRMAR